ncbi:glycosyltransferase [Egbenema bharatensis]|uniref:glycosyltransferase n=1 Tax=Egbenema bharatensis TaxID=3463334 RepID=UPI003A87C9D3
MKIAILTSGFLPVVDGVTVSALQRLQRLSQWGHQVRVFCPDYRPLEAIYPNWKDYTGEILPGVTVVNLPSGSFMGVEFERNVSRTAYSILIQELQKFSPDLIHVDEPERMFVGFLHIPGVQFARKSGIPCIGFFRTNFMEYVEDFFPLPPIVLTPLKAFLKQLIVKIYNAYDLTLVASPITHEKLVHMGIKNTHYALLLGCDTDQFHPDLRQAGFFKRNYNLPQVDRTVKLVFLGRLTPDKGWRFTMNAFAQVVQQVDRKAISLLIAGDGELRDEIEQRLSQFVPQVHLLGRVPPDEVPALLANSDVHVTTSEKETRGLTVLEAFASGIPVIAPRAGGVVENIRDGWNGFLFTPKDQRDFVTKLQTLIQNPEQRQMMGKNGRECIADYSWDTAVKNLINIWEAQIAEKETLKSKI